MKWEEWLRRPFTPLYLSIFCDGMTRKGMRKIGIDEEAGMFLFERSTWYRNKEVMARLEKNVEKYFKEGGSIFKISRGCEKFRTAKRKEILNLIKEKKDPIKKLKELYDILSVVISYIWVAHGIEEVYKKILDKEAPKYATGDVEKYIGDISFPAKKNDYTLLEEAILKGEDLERLLKKYSWMKSRDGFSPGYTLEEFQALKKKILSEKREKHKRVEIPKALRKIAKETQELVYFRTLRTDVYYEFLFLARPILADVAEKYSLDFDELRYYSIQDLISGKIRKHSKDFSWVYYNGKSYFFNSPILPEKQYSAQELKGTIAYSGKIRGIAKVVKNVSQIYKVNEGDILVAGMTAPDFVIAMKKAAAFVTDEGGITCHAAIVAREMKKPCITGTKIATKIFKDGDYIEVDATKGIVRKL